MCKPKKDIPSKREGPWHCTNLPLALTTLLTSKFSFLLILLTSNRLFYFLNPIFLSLALILFFSSHKCYLSLHEKMIKINKIACINKLLYLTSLIRSIKFFCIRSIALKRVTSLRVPSPPHCVRVTLLVLKKCCSGGEPLATSRVIYLLSIVIIILHNRFPKLLWSEDSKKTCELRIKLAATCQLVYCYS